jgi:anti-sigma B factor antagonist
MAELDLVETNDAFTHVALRGRLDAAGADTVGVKLTSQTVERRKPAIVDLSEVPFIASLGIGMLVQVARSLASHGAQAVALAPNEPVRGVLRLMQLGDLLPVVATREEALRALGLD